MLRVCGYRLGDPRIIARRLGLALKADIPQAALPGSPQAAAAQTAVTEAVIYELERRTSLDLGLHSCVRMAHGKPTTPSLVIAVRTSEEPAFKPPEDRVLQLAKLMGREGKRPAWWTDVYSTA